MNQPRAQAIHENIYVPISTLSTLLFMTTLLFAGGLWAQSADPPAASVQGTQSQAITPTQPPATRSDEVEQMRTDLNRMESLLGNMSAEIEFLHDQNLQILLRTNAQMWTILLRDLKRQIDHAEQRRNSGSPQTGSIPPNTKSR